MCKSATAAGGRLRPWVNRPVKTAPCGLARGRRCALFALLFALVPLWAQTPSDWHHSGNSLLDLSLAGLASGPVDRVWYSPDGSVLSLATGSGKIFQTSDFDTWLPTRDATFPPAPIEPWGVRQLPETGSRIRASS